LKRSVLKYIALPERKEVPVPDVPWFLSAEEENEVYDTGKSVRLGGSAGGSECEDMRVEFGERTVVRMGKGSAG
jgi:hypothetical protein